MNHLLQPRRATPLLVTILLTAAAGCEGGQVTNPAPGGARLTESHETHPDAQPITICKDGPAGTYSFSVSATAGNLPAGTAFTLAAGECKVVWEGTSTNAETIRVTEEDLPEGVEFDRIEVRNGPGDGTATVDDANRTVTFVGNIDHGGLATFFNVAAPPPPPPPPPPTGDEGCTPGYWKNHPASWTIPGSTDFDSFFGVDFFTPDITFADAIGLGGGGANALARSAVAAALAIDHPEVDYPMTMTELIQAVRDAYDGVRPVESVKDELDANNNLGCPID